MAIWNTFSLTAAAGSFLKMLKFLKDWNVLFCFSDIFIAYCVIIVMMFLVYISRCFVCM